MKKRFTIMLDEETIRLIKAMYDFYSPTTVRNELETVIKDYTIATLTFNKSKKLTRKLKV